MHAIHDQWPVDEVVVNDPRDTMDDPNAAWKRGLDPAWLADLDPQWLAKSGATIATIGDTCVVLRNMGVDFAERIAPLLACARAARPKA